MSSPTDEHLCKGLQRSHRTTLSGGGRPVHAHSWWSEPGSVYRPAGRSFTAAIRRPGGVWGQCDTWRQALACINPELVVVERIGAAIEGGCSSRELLGCSPPLSRCSSRCACPAQDPRRAARRDGLRPAFGRRLARTRHGREPLSRDRGPADSPQPQRGKEDLHGGGFCPFCSRPGRSDGTDACVQAGDLENARPAIDVLSCAWIYQQNEQAASPTAPACRSWQKATWLP